MTEKPETGEVPEFEMAIPSKNHKDGTYTFYAHLRWSDGDRLGDVAKAEHLAAAGFVPAASLAAAEARVAELEHVEHLLEVERHYHEETKGYRQHAEQLLASERAGREQLEQRILWLCDMYRDTKPDNERVRTLGEVAAAFRHIVITPDQSTSAPPPVAEVDRVQVEALRMTLDAVTETLNQRNEQLRAQAAENRKLRDAVTQLMISGSFCAGTEQWRVAIKQAEGALRVSLVAPAAEGECTCAGKPWNPLQPFAHRGDCPIAGGKCRACQKPLLKANNTVADGCPCNAPRGMNHGLVPENTCTCLQCDPAQTGSARVAEPPLVPTAERKLIPTPPLCAKCGAIDGLCHQRGCLTMAEQAEPPPATAAEGERCNCMVCTIQRTGSAVPSEPPPATAAEGKHNPHTDPECTTCGHVGTDHPQGARCGAPTEDGCCDCMQYRPEPPPAEAFGPRSLAEVPVFISEAIKVDLELFTARLVAALGKCRDTLGGSGSALAGMLADELARDAKT